MAFAKKLKTNWKQTNSRDGTSEDQSRTLLYKIEQKRKESESNFNNIDEYLYSLGLKLYVSHNVLDHIQRVSQLTQKTNQFNLTTKRYTSNEINSFIKKDISRYRFSLLKPIYVNEKVTLKVYRSKLDNSVIIAKVLKEKNEIAFSSEIQLIS